MVKCERTFPAPASLAAEKRKGERGNYREPDVVQRLRNDFHDKCYICETPDLQDPQVEHLIPHKGDLDLKFDWNNLFWSCAHCNSVKNQEKYTGKIIDCCKVDPEQHLRCQYSNNQIDVQPMDAEESSKMTAELIMETFNLRNTGMRIVASEQRLKSLQREMNIFFNELTRYEHEKTAFNKRRVVAKLRRSSAYAAFKRSYIRGKQCYTELQEYV